MTLLAVLIPSLSCRSQCERSLSGGHYPVASLSGPYHGFNVLESQPVVKLELAEFVYKVKVKCAKCDGGSRNIVQR